MVLIFKHINAYFQQNKFMQQNAVMTSKYEIFGLLTQNVGLDQGTCPLIDRSRK